MLYVYKGRKYALGEYRNAFKNFFKDELKDGKTLYIDMISGKKRLINQMPLLQQEQV